MGLLPGNESTDTNYPPKNKLTLKQCQQLTLSQVFRPRLTRNKSGDFFFGEKLLKSRSFNVKHVEHVEIHVHPCHSVMTFIKCSDFQGECFRTFESITEQMTAVSLGRGDEQILLNSSLDSND